VQLRAIIDHDAARIQVAGEFAGTPDVHTLSGLERPNDFTTNDNFGSLDFRGDPSVGTNREGAVGKGDASFELAIKDEISLAGDFTFELDAAIHVGRR
jgi:hypothetical protein